MSAVRESLAQRLDHWRRRHPAWASSLATLIVVSLLVGFAVAFQLSVERVMVTEAYDLLDDLLNIVDGTFKTKKDQYAEAYSKWHKVLEAQLG